MNEKTKQSPSPVVAYCQRCHFPIHENEPSWWVTNDDILCPYFNARRLVFCTKDCLERTMESVLTQIKRNRSRSRNSPPTTLTTPMSDSDSGNPLNAL